MGDTGSGHRGRMGHAGTSPAEHDDFVSMLMHALLLLSECQGVGLPRPFQVDLGSLGADVREEIESLQRQLRSAMP